MKTIELKLRDEYIRLGQGLRAAGLVDTGADAKFLIQDGEVSVNGETEYQRGKKLHGGDVVSFEGSVVKIVR